MTSQHANEDRAMNCDETRRHWNLYHDSEGDAALHLAINEHLASCPDCAQWFSGQTLLEDALKRRMAETPPDPQLWPSVLADAGVATPRARSKNFGPVLLLAAVAAILLIAVTVGLGMLSNSGSVEPSLSALAAAQHVELSGGAPFHSPSDLEVEQYLRTQVTFPVRCPPRKDAGFAVAGAGTCRIAGEPAAYLVGTVDHARATIFILSQTSLPAFGHEQAALRSESIHRCREGNLEMALAVIDRNLVLVIGQTRGEHLVRVLNAYGSYPHDSSG